MAVADGVLEGPDFGGREHAGERRVLAQTAALDMQPGERLRWQLFNRSDLRLIRLEAPEPKKNPEKGRLGFSAESFLWVDNP